MGVEKNNTCVILHLYYVDMLDEIIGYLVNIPFDYNLIITIVDKSFDKTLEQKILDFKSDTKIIIVDGSGMDIKPFLIAYKQVRPDCKYVLKLHTKKSIAIGANMGVHWFKQMMQHTLDSPELVSSIIKTFENSNVGMIGGNLLYDQSQGIYPNEDNIEELKKTLEISVDKYKWVAGSIFWCKRDVLDLLNNKIDYLINIMPTEYKTDGTLAHAMERVFGAMVYYKNNTVRKFPLILQNGKKRILFINNHSDSQNEYIRFKKIVNSIVGSDKYDCCQLNLVEISDRHKLKNSVMIDELVGGSDEEKMLYLQKIFSPDLVFANSYKTFDFAKHFDCKKNIFVQEYKSILSGLNFNALRNFDKVFVINQGLKDILKGNEVESELIPFQYYTDMSYDYKEWIIGIGDASYKSGVDRFISIAEKMPSEKFLWIGEYSDISDGYVKLSGMNYDNPYELEEVHNKIKIPSNVIFIGNQSLELIKLKWLPNSKVLLSLEYDEPFSSNVLEAKLHNKIVITIKDAGDSHTVCDDKDLVIDSYDEDMIVDFIKSIKQKEVLNRNIIEKISNNGNLVIDEISKLLTHDGSKKRF